MRNLLTIILIICSFTLKAQVWRTIPDNNFADQLSNVLPPNVIVGNQIDISSPEVLNLDTLIIAQVSGITDLTGIEYFVNLKYLRASGNDISILDSLPPSLIYVDLSANQLTSLPSLPSGLINLICWRNQLIALPDLPPRLRNLYCNDNLLTSIPTLPDSLMVLNCEFNQLTILPFIPDSVIGLYIQKNQITYLSQDVFHEGLVSINAGWNQISNLPTLPSTLLVLFIYYNQLSTLPQLPESLERLSCNNNQLTCLPVLPDSMTSLDCANNLITALPLLPLTLRGLFCNNNNISNFPEFPASIIQNHTVLPLNYWEYSFRIENNPFTCIPSLGGLASNDPQFPQGFPPICSSGNPNDWAEDCSTISVGSNSLEDIVKIYPNPVIKEFVIETEGELKSLRIFDLNGRLISEFEINNDKIINVQNLASGVYIVEIYFLDRIVRKKLVIEK